MKFTKHHQLKRILFLMPFILLGSEPGQLPVKPSELAAELEKRLFNEIFEPWYPWIIDSACGGYLQLFFYPDWTLVPDETLEPRSGGDHWYTHPGVGMGHPRRWIF